MNIEYGTDFGSSYMGQKLREKLLPLINGDEKVVLDFTVIPRRDIKVPAVFLPPPMSSRPNAVSGEI